MKCAFNHGQTDFFQMLAAKENYCLGSCRDTSNLKKDSSMHNPDISVKTYIVISLVFAALFTASVVAIGSPVFDWIFGMVAIATALMAISQSWLDHRASRA